MKAFAYFTEYIFISEWYQMCWCVKMVTDLHKIFKETDVKIVNVDEEV